MSKLRAGGVTPALVAARPGWSVTAAARSGRIYPIDDDLVSSLDRAW